MKIQKLARLLLLITIFYGTMLTAGTIIAMPAFANENNTPQNNANKYIIGLGDILDISIWNEPDISRTVFVRLDGKISLPLIGGIQAHGQSPETLSQHLQEQFSKFITEPSVSVILKASKSKRYYILGQIKMPGEFAIEYPITVLQAIARSGGFLEWAKKSRILIVRQDDDSEKIITFNYDTLIKGENLKQNILIKPGDTIIIP